jgi:alkylated DNA nucleotide flippase Atl1/predicted DNA-binding protein (MmcQ/YjbR family)
MTIEQKIFSRRRFSTRRMEDYGFVNKDACYSLSKEFMDGDFTAEIRVYQNGSVQGRVMDNMMGEEYIPLRMPNYTGAFVGSVRAAYEELLLDIADKCCTDVAFVSDQSNRIAALILDKYSVEPDFPWDEGEHEPSGVFRHGSNNKWFGLIMNIDRRHLEKNAAEEMVDVINLKADESKMIALHKIRGIYPAFHMNHSKWISVVLDDTLDDRDVMDLVEESFRLTGSPSGVLNEKLIREALEIADSIPPGKVMSYGQIAALMGRPKNARLVGKIMSMQDRFGNHPCHRVVNSAGRTVPGWTEQRELLEAEGVGFRENGNVDMCRFRMD